MLKRSLSKLNLPDLNLSRRNALKFLAVVGAAFALGKFAGPIVSLFTGEKVLHEALFQNFKVTETNRSLTFADRDGTPIFIIDKDSF